MADRFDVAVIGGGPVGAAFALALRPAALAVVLLESRAAGATPSDVRPLALSHGSRLLLERLDVWQALAPVTPIERIHVSQRGAFGRTLLTAAEAALPALGYVVDYASLVSTLDRAVAHARIPVVHGARVTAVDDEEGHVRVRYQTGAGATECTASLVVVADGTAAAAATTVRTRDYGQSAITARVRSELPHRHTAYERFTSDGPIALLPFADEYALVWTVPHDKAEALDRASPQDFLERLHERFGERVGRFTSVASRASHALLLRVAERTTLARTILIGNAAQALHPVAGQGFNLGLRDAWELAGEVRRDGPQAHAPLDAYRARRRIDRAGGIAFTDTVVRLFGSEWLPLELLRGAGLALLDCVPPAKNFVVRRMVFGARG